MSVALELDDLRKSFGKTEIIRGLNLKVQDAERHAIIGPNGAGKSTMFNLITGRFAPSGGAVRLHGQNLAGLAPYQINLSARRDLPAGTLSYAEQRALEIGITIAGGADVIMLDEPTAGMSNTETDYIVGLIRKVTENKTLIIVEHDMGVVFGLADRISVLVYGEIIATGPPEEVRANPRVQEAYLGAALEADH